MSVDDGGAEGGKVCVFEIVRGDRNVEVVAIGLRSAMHCEVLRSRNDDGVRRIVALQPTHERGTDVGCEKGIFAIRLLATSPTWIAKDIDIWGPDVEAKIDAGSSGLARLAIFQTGLAGDGPAFVEDQVLIPGRSHTDGLRKDGCIAGTGEAMETLAPVIVLRHT